MTCWEPQLQLFCCHDMFSMFLSQIVPQNLMVNNQVSHLESHRGSIAHFQTKPLNPHPSFRDFQGIWIWPRPHDPHLEVVEAVVARTLTVADLNLHTGDVDYTGFHASVRERSPKSSQPLEGSWEIAENILWRCIYTIHLWIDVSLIHFLHSFKRIHEQSFSQLN